MSIKLKVNVTVCLAVNGVVFDVLLIFLRHVLHYEFFDGPFHYSLLYLTSFLPFNLKSSSQHQWIYQFSINKINNNTKSRKHE